MSDGFATVMQSSAGDAALVAIDRRATGWTIALSRADKMNALSATVVEALDAALDEATHANTPLIVLEGAGRNFSAGFDFGDFESHTEDALLARFVRIELLLQRVARSTVATLGFAHGRNFGAGVDLFAVCHQRIASPDATFRMPGLGFGLQLGTRRFADIVGRERARSILTGLATFDANAALQMGFVHRILERDRWPSVVAEAEAAASAQALAADGRAMCVRALDAGHHDEDLADLVRSAALPGLKARIRSYLAAQSSARRTTAS